MLGSAAWKIARIYHKKNKKRFIINAISLCFSFTILICICYVSISFNIRYKDIIDSENTLFSCQISTDSDEYFNDVNSLISGEKHVKDSIMHRWSSKAFLKCKEYPSFFAPSKVYYPTIEIDGVKYNYEDECRKENYSSDTFCYFENDSKMLLESEISYAKKNNMSLIYGDNKINENSLFISSRFCDYFNLDYNSVIGKKISYKCYIDKDNTVDLIENYVINGVFNNDIYSIPTRSMLESGSPLFWLPFETYTKISDYITTGIHNLNIIQYDSFSNFKTGVTKYLNYEANRIIDVSIKISELASYYLELDPVVSISQYILFTISLFILFVGILSLFNVMVFISEKQIGFLDMCQAIGLQRKDRNKYTFMQNLLIVGPSVVISSVVSFILSIFITKKLNNYITLSGIFSNKTIFELKYYFVVLIMFLIASTLLIIIISLLIDKCLSKVKMNRRIL